MAQHVCRLRPELKTIIRTRIRTARYEKGWSLQDLGDRSFMSKQALFMIESGAQHPSIGTLDLISQALGVKMGYLLGELPDGTK